VIALLRVYAPLWRRQDGQTMAEYSVVLAVITIAVVVTLGLLSTAIKGKMNSVVGIL
jgi:Flp pilus assembly pilin Flp